MVNWTNISSGVTDFVLNVNSKDGDSTRLSRSEYRELSDYLCGNADLKDNDKKYVRAYMNKYTTKSERKEFELSQKIQAIAEKPHTFEELQKALGKNSPFLITNENGMTILERLGLMKKNDDGTYNISALSRILQNELPDMKMDRYFVTDNFKSKYPDADINKIRNILDKKAEQSDIENPGEIYVSNRDLTKLVKLCGFQVKSHIKGDFSVTAGMMLTGGPEFGICENTNKSTIENNLFTDKSEPSEEEEGTLKHAD